MLFLADRAEALLRWFPADALPMEPEPRFAALFAAQPRWTREQLDPYIQTLQVRGTRTGNFKM